MERIMTSDILKAIYHVGLASVNGTMSKKTASYLNMILIEKFIKQNIENTTKSMLKYGLPGLRYIRNNS